VKILANPIFLRAALVLFCASFAFLLGLIFIRLLRQSIADEADISPHPAPSLDTLPMHVYNTVIQQLKQQKHDLQLQSHAEQQRARASEILNQAVISNLSSGVLIFGPNGLVKTSNPGAKAILGFASPTGMRAQDIFRGAAVREANVSAPDPCSEESLDETKLLSDEIEAVLHEGSVRREVQAEYETPAGEKRFIKIIISSVPAGDGGLLGLTCLIHDLSEFEQTRRKPTLPGEVPTDTALELRTSLLAISGYAKQLAGWGESSSARQLAADIIHEVENLDRTIEDFLCNREVARSVAAGSEK
jgi:PAS domain-containing protein